MKVVVCYAYVFFFVFLAGAVNAASSEETPSAGSNSTEFIRKCCAATLYPGLCYTSLSGYANEVQQSTVELAHVAAKVTLARLRSTAFHVAALRRSATGPERGALRDCSEQLDDAAEWARNTVKELKGLAGAVGPKVASRVSNALTWMSAALTCEDTCTDGLLMVAAGSVKADVCHRVRKVEKYTSNSLALIHSLGFNR
ncbi:pectinesterase inhibitor 11-like [Musa acuminata AAA Group]|uniref:pectinesterase inhibitor 11-like n=1 Tax=Musa acuminata AAA Group TaxID=214697 RepID=UPI0031E1AB43